MPQNGETDTGYTTRVIRDGDTVRHPVRPWTPAVHALLQHLESAGLEGVSRVLGIDEDQHEVLSFISGEVARRPWPEVLRRSDGLTHIASFPSRYHRAVKGFVPPTGAERYMPDLTWGPGQIICHGDLGPWNAVWHGPMFVGLIDWDSV